MTNEDITWSFSGKDYVLKIKEDNIEAFIKNESGYERVTSEIDKSIVATVLDFLTPDLKNSILIDTITLKSKNYDIYLDKKHALYSFFERVDGQYKLPDTDTLYELNMRYNDNRVIKDETEYIGERIQSLRENQTERVIHRLLRFTNGILVVTITLNALTFLPKNVRWKFDYRVNDIKSDIVELVEDTKEREGIQDFDKEKVKKAILKNPNLTKEQKSLLSELDRVIEENISYIDIEKTLMNLSEVKVVEQNENHFGKYGYTTASYVISGSNKNTINLYPVYFEHTKEEKDSSFFHEIGHLLTERSMFSELSSQFDALMYYHIYTNNGLHIEILEELANQLFTNDYYSYLTGKPAPKNTGYFTSMFGFYALCEIIDPEVIREFKFKNNASILVDALKELDSDDDRAYRFLTSYETFALCLKEYNEQPTKENGEALLSKGEFIRSEIAHYYEAKYNRDMEGDIVMTSLLSSVPYTKETIMPQVLLETFCQDGKGYNIGINPRNYLAKDGEQRMQVIIFDGEKERVEYIDDSNRYVEGYSKSQFI